MTTNLSPSRPWRCTICGNPISVGDGQILIQNANPTIGPVGGYPMRATPDHPPHTYSEAERIARDPDVATMTEQQTYQKDDVVWFLDREPNIRIRATHYACDQNTDGYAIAVERAPTCEAWVAWISYLQEKNWLGQFDTASLLRYWWWNRSEEIPSVHNL